MTAQEKYEKLQEILSGLESAAVAFSGGADSTFLLAAAEEALGEKVVAVTAVSSLVPVHECERAERFCAERGIRQISFDPCEMKVAGFADNPPERCYICKRALFGKIFAIAGENGLAAVVEGTHTDDAGDYRPGLRALEELGARSPLKEAGMTKADIRVLSKEMGLPTWDLPSAACLATRIPYGERITEEKLQKIERAERALRDLGFRQVRVRAHGGDLARVEVATEEMEQLFDREMRARVHRELKQVGFTHVAADLAGYRTGSMNEALGERSEKTEERPDRG